MDKTENLNDTPNEDILSLNVTNEKNGQEYNITELATRAQNGDKEAEASLLGIIDELLRVEAFMDSPFAGYLENLKANFSNTTKYKTHDRAGDVVAHLPERIPQITTKNLQYAISLHQEGDAYIRALKTNASGLKQENGILFFNNIPATEATLKDMYTDEIILDIDVELLRLYYGIILNEFLKKNENTDEPELDEIIHLYLPDLAKSLGYGSNFGTDTKEALISKTQSFQTVVGVINKSVYSVLNFEYYDDETGVIAFSSPYMNRVIRGVFNASIRRNKDGNLLYSKTGKLLTNASYSYLIKSSIYKCKNKSAKENVHLIVALIEQTGQTFKNKEGYFEAHITAENLLKKNAIFCKQYATSTNKNQLLARLFKKTYELLDQETTLNEKFIDFHYEKLIPTPATLNTMVFRFMHRGKTQHLEK